MKNRRDKLLMCRPDFFGVDYVLYVGLSKFTTHEPGSEYLFRGEGRIPRMRDFWKQYHEFIPTLAAYGI